jgi:hypothetical protein
MEIQYFVVFCSFIINIVSRILEILERISKTLQLVSQNKNHTSNFTTWQ